MLNTNAYFEKRLFPVFPLNIISRRGIKAMKEKGKRQPTYIWDLAVELIKYS